MFEKEFYVIVFDSTHHAIQTEKLLKEKYKIETIPTPREITASCGLSIKFNTEQLDSIVQELSKGPEEKFKVFKVEKQGTRRSIEKII